MVPALTLTLTFFYKHDDAMLCKYRRIIKPVERIQFIDIKLGSFVVKGVCRQLGTRRSVITKG